MLTRLSTPPSLPDKAHDSLQIQHQVGRELTAPEHTPKKKLLVQYNPEIRAPWLTKDRRPKTVVKSQISTYVPDQSSHSKLPESLREEITITEDLDTVPSEQVDLCTPEAIIGQGRQERSSPCPQEMVRGGSPPLKPRTDFSILKFDHAFKPMNKLKTQVNSTLSGPAISSRRTRQRSPGEGSQVPFNLTSPKKRQRRGSYTASTVTSRISINEDSEDHSNTVRSEAPNVRKSVGNKGHGAVSHPAEHKIVESVANPAEPRGQSKRKSSESSHLAKRQRLDEKQRSSKAKVSSLLKDKHDSSMGTSPSSLEDPADPIQDPSQDSAPIWSGTARLKAPRTQNGLRGSRESSTQSQYFPRQQPRPKAAPSSHTNSNKARIAQPADDSEDELARDSPNTSSKLEMSKANGKSILAEYGLPKKHIGDDISRSIFKTPASRDPKKSEISFGLSSIIAGTLMLKHGESPGAWRIELHPEKKIFEPYKDGVLMAEEESELVLNPQKLRRVFYGHESKKIFIYRHLGPQKSPLVFIELDSGDPDWFAKCLQGLVGEGVPIEPEDR